MSDIIVDANIGPGAGTRSSVGGARTMALYSGATMVPAYGVTHGARLGYGFLAPRGDDSAEYVVIAVNAMRPEEQAPEFTTVDAFESYGSVTRHHATPLETYFRVERRALREQLHELVLRESPSVPEIVSTAASVPGVVAQERAMDLLSSSIGMTVAFVHWLETITDRLEPYYAYKVWNIVLGGLGFVPAGHPAAKACASIIEHYSLSPDPVQRQSAFEAMESFAMIHGDVTGLNA